MLVSPPKRKHGSSGRSDEGADGKMFTDSMDTHETRRKRKQARGSAMDASGAGEFENPMESKEGEGGDSLASLLKTFASMAVTNSNMETCPLCFNTFKLDEFSGHVYKCLEKMESNVKSSSDDAQWMGSAGTSAFAGGDCKFGAKCKITTADHFRFMRHPKVMCPVCSEMFHMYEINAHINFCLEKGDTDGPEEATMGDAKEAPAGGSGRPPSPSMTTQQMAACAKAILDAKSGKSDVSLVSMLNRFKSLGFTRANLKNRLDEIKKSSPSKTSPLAPTATDASPFEPIPAGAAGALGPDLFAMKPSSFTSFKEEQPGDGKTSGGGEAGGSEGAAGAGGAVGGGANL